MLPAAERMRCPFCGHPDVDPRETQDVRDRLREVDPAARASSDVGGFAAGLEGLRGKR